MACGAADLSGNDTQQYSTEVIRIPPEIEMPLIVDRDMRDLGRWPMSTRIGQLANLVSHRCNDRYLFLQALGEPRPVQAVSILDGLHHEYSLIPAGVWVSVKWVRSAASLPRYRREPADRPQRRQAPSHRASPMSLQRPDIARNDGACKQLTHPPKPHAG